MMHGQTEINHSVNFKLILKAVFTEETVVSLRGTWHL